MFQRAWASAQPPALRFILDSTRTGRFVDIIVAASSFLRSCTFLPCYEKQQKSKERRTSSPLGLGFYLHHSKGNINLLPTSTQNGRLLLPSPHPLGHLLRQRRSPGILASPPLSLRANMLAPPDDRIVQPLQLPDSRHSHTANMHVFDPGPEHVRVGPVHRVVDVPMDEYSPDCADRVVVLWGCLAAVRTSFLLVAQLAMHEFKECTGFLLMK